LVAVEFSVGVVLIRYTVLVMAVAMGRIRLRWAVAFLSALAALDLAAFASDFDSTALSGAVDFQATYAAVQYLVLGDIVCFGFAVSLGYSVG